MPINKKKSDRIDLISPKELTRKVELYKKIKNLKGSRNKAFRNLVELGLEAECEKSPDLKAAIQNEIDKQQED